jgi:hypothetical protein
MSETREKAPRMPGWVKWPALAIGVLVVALVVMRLLGIQHGPGMHMPSSPTGTHAPGSTHQ